MDFKRLDGENDKEYILRICGAKTDIGCTWDDIANIINEELGYDRTGLAYRKFYTRHNHDIDMPKLDYETQSSIAIRMERDKLQATKLEESRFLRHYSRFDLFYSNIREAIESLPMPTLNPLPVSCSDKEYVLTLSDLHYGSTYESENNEYSRKECERRLSALLGEVIEFVKYEGVRHMHILSLGDTVQGILRMTDIQINDIPVVDCVVEVSRLLAQFLNELSAYTFIDFYAVSAANHSQTRPLGSKASELATEDVERIIINYISDMLLNNPRVWAHTDMSRDYVCFKIFDYNIIAMHGHQIKDKNNAIKDMSALCQKFYDYMFMGHYHSRQEICVGEKDGHNIEVLISPALIGSCQYSDKMMTGAKSAACIYEFDERHGHTGTKTFILN